MMLLADSGSSKTSWYLAEGAGLHFTTPGINPYFQETAEIAAELREKLLPQLPAGVSARPLNVFFYGAGCSTPTKNKSVQAALSQCFPAAEIHVAHDLLAAARAVCGKEEGIAAILGTGSNSCYYDGRDIVLNTPSLGYLLGDEGSGACLGKRLVQNHLNSELPEDLSADFFTSYRQDREMILESVYKKPFPNRYLASFVPFLLRNLDHEFVKSMVREEFQLFFERHICKYPLHREVPMGCIGSVGFHFSAILRNVAESSGIAIKEIWKSPMEGLIRYHAS